jgi:putative glutamine amidotransferase
MPMASIPQPARPLVLLPCCQRMLGEHPFHVLGGKYAQAARLAGGLPLAIAAAQPEDIEALLDLADGIVLTGSPSNVHPQHYGDVPGAGVPCFDDARDTLNLALIPRALERGIPLLGICRGFQEANVALGGSLHQAVHAVQGLQDHRGAGGRSDACAEEIYAPAHELAIEPGGLLERILGSIAEPVRVNSVHGQGVARLACGLRVEARAPDGLVEAFSLPDAAAFNLFVQWHPEWRAAENPVSMQILRAFGAACGQHRAQRGPS